MKMVHSLLSPARLIQAGRVLSHRVWIQWVGQPKCPTLLHYPSFVKSSVLKKCALLSFDTYIYSESHFHIRIEEEARENLQATQKQSDIQDPHCVQQVKDVMSSLVVFFTAFQLGSVSLLQQMPINSRTAQRLFFSRLSSQTNRGWFRG